MQANPTEPQPTLPEAQANPTETTTNSTEVSAPTQKEIEKPVSHDDDTPAMAEFRKKVLNKPAVVTLADQRKVIGKIVCIDNQKNIVIVDAVEEVPPQYIAKINENLPVISNYLMKLKNFVTLPPEVLADEEKVKQLQEEFFKNRFYLGQGIIPGYCITKLEVI